MDPRLMILAAGISSRMKRSVPMGEQVAEKLVAEADQKPKAMIGVGKNGRPFMDYLLWNAARAGYREVVLVINERDEFTKPYYRNKDIWGLDLSFARQGIPPGREKPLGTADAVLQGMRAKLYWSGGKFTVCNSDNLYSVNVMKKLMEDPHLCAMADYDRDALGVEAERVKAFAVIWKDEENYLTDIVEKPGSEAIERARDLKGRVGVSMNIFRLDYDAMLPVLEACPLHPERQEKELPTALKMLMKENPRAVFTIPVAEPVPDLTSKGDLLKVKTFLEALDD